MKKTDLAPGKYDVVLTTYEMVVSDASYFAHQYYRYIVLDEAQRIKNDNSLIGQACRRLRGAGRLLITGTPLQNDLHELWCLLNFLFPECFEDSQMFDAAFSKVMTQRLGQHTPLPPRVHTNASALPSHALLHIIWRCLVQDDDDDDEDEIKHISFAHKMCAWPSACECIALPLFITHPALQTTFRRPDSPLEA
jgi:hypothetical protein